MAILNIYCIYWTVWDRYMQVLILGRAPRTKETLPDFLKWRRVTRPPLVFRGLTGSQRTPGFWGVTLVVLYSSISIFNLTWHEFNIKPCLLYQHILMLSNYAWFHFTIHLSYYNMQFQCITSIHNSIYEI